MMENGSGKKSDGKRLGGGAIASLVGVGCLVTFMFQNAEDVRLDFLFWHFTWPLWLVTMASAILGALVFRPGRDAPTQAPQGAPRRPARLSRPRVNRYAGEDVAEAGVEPSYVDPSSSSASWPPSNRPLHDR